MVKYKRILLKLSGESLAGDKDYGIDENRIREYTVQIAALAKAGVQLGIVVGGGNIFRGLQGTGAGFDRVKGDQMGMLATVINSLALSSVLKTQGIKSRVFTAIRMEPVGEYYTKEKAIGAMEQGEVVILSGGTGNPYFTTDTASALRAVELEADIMLKGTRVNGVYTADPEKDPSAEKFEKISFDEMYARNLRVMDLTATTLCRENNMPVMVFNMDKKGNLEKVVAGDPVGTIVHP
jgi:uridylate kinase